MLSYFPLGAFLQQHRQSFWSNLHFIELCVFIILMLFVLYVNVNIVKRIICFHDADIKLC